MNMNIQQIPNVNNQMTNMPQQRNVRGGMYGYQGNRVNEEE